MALATADRNLLFGILALQMDFISRDALIKGMNAWVLEKAKGLGQILVEQKTLSNERHALLEALVQEHLKQHDNDPEKSLAAVRSLASVRDELQQITDSDLQASLAHVSVARQSDTDSWATHGSASVGTRTASGLRFRILRPHARGGLGEVFVAQDEELHREVALKQIQDRHADEPDSRARFLLEGEITGGLEHPGIVPVYGLGQYADGRPFYAMRFIRGDNLKDAIARFYQADRPGRDPGERALEFRKLLGRFLDVCNAIGYAHSRAVLHRDLKPGNIMLGKYGETLVVDWGLAKPLGQQEHKSSTLEAPLLPVPSSLGQTQPGSAVGTPAFMSPEQAAGRLDLLGPTSDIYSLGATLYCLLTGHPPFEDSDRGVLLQRVQRGDFPPPRQRNRQVAPALEAICLKAMALQPADRYSSALELAGEIEHWLADEPVAAYPEPLRLRAWRWAPRHRTLVAAVLAAVVVATLLGGFGIWWFQQQQAESAARQKELDQAEASRRQGIEAKARLALQRAHALLDDGWRQNDLVKLKEAKAEADSAVEVADTGASADTRQQAVHFQKEVQDHLNRARKNNALLLALLDVSTPRETSTFVQNPAGGLMRLVNPSVDEQYASAFRNWGLDMDRTPEATIVTRLQEQPPPVLEEIVAGLDQWMQEQRKQKRPEAQWRRLLRVTDQLHPSELRRGLRALLIDEVPPREQIVDGLTAALLPWTTFYELEHGKHWRELLELQGKVDPTKEPVLTVVLLANTLSAAGDTAGAENLLRGALAARPEQVVLLEALGKLLERQGRTRLGEAIACYRAIRALRPQLGITLAEALRKFGKAVEGEAVLRDLARRQPNNPETSAYLGNALRAQHKLDNAETAYRKAIALEPQNALNYHNLGTVLYAQKRVGDAVAVFRKAIDLQPNLVQAYFHLSIALKNQNKKSEANAILLKGLSLEPEDAETYYYRGNVLLGTRKQPAEAAVAYHQAVALAPDYAAAYEGLGQALSEQKKYAAAERAYRRAIQLEPDLVDVYINLGLILEQQKKYAEAEATCRKVLELQPDHATAYNNLGAYLQDQNRLVEAAAAFRKAVTLQPDFVLANNNLANTLRDLKQPTEAAAVYRKVIALQPKNAEAYVNLGLMLREQKRFAEAVAVLRTAATLQPDYAAYTDLGGVLLDSHQFTEAETAFRKAIQLQSNNAVAYDNLGIAFQAHKKPDEAAATWRKAIKLNPTNVAYYIKLGIALRDQKNFAESAAVLRQAIALQPQNALAYDHLALTLREQHQLDEALAAFRKSDQLRPNQSYTRYNLNQTERWLELAPKLDAYLTGKQKPASPQESVDLGEFCAAFHQQYRAALRFLTDAFQHDPKLAEDLQVQHRYNAACYAALAAAGAGKDASKSDAKERTEYRRQALDWLHADLKAYQDLLAKNKENRAFVEQRLRYWRSDSDLAGIRDQKSLAALPKTVRQECQRLWDAVQGVLQKIAEDKAIDLGPDDPTSYYNLGVALYAKKDWQDASSAFRKAAKLAPSNDHYHNRLGNALYWSKHWQEALAAYHQAIELNPRKAIYYENLGNVLREQKKFDDAAMAYRKTLQLDPRYAAAHHNLGNVLSSTKDWAGAIAAFRQAIVLAPKNATYHNSLGNALFAQQDWSDAVAAYRQAIALAPKNAVYHSNLGAALREQGELEAASATCRQAIALQPNYAFAYNNLGLALRLQQKLPEAVAAFHKAAQLLPRQVNIRNNLRQTERWLALSPTLEACLAGQQKPASPRESVELGEVCAALRHRYLAALRFMTDAFREDPKLADNLLAGYRYKAASYAVLAAAGKGKDADSLSTPERAELRRQSLAWLRAHFQANKELLDQAKENRAIVRQRLTSWLRDANLASVRAEKSLAALPVEERKNWQRLWTDIKDVLANIATATP